MPVWPRSLARSLVREPVPLGFATTAAVYRGYVEANELAPKLRAARSPMFMAAGSRSPWPVPPFDGFSWTQSFLRRSPSRFARPIGTWKRCGTPDLAVAVRSSATAEDLPQASFAGQQETYLNVHGESELLRACRKCYASLFTDRAIVYRETNGFDHMQVALSIGIQKMVRADGAGAGVMFTLDTETGFPGVVVINAAWGLGENVVQGTVKPDKYVIFKPLLQTPHLADHRKVARRQGRRSWSMVRRRRAHARNINTTRREREAMVLPTRKSCSSAVGPSPSRSTMAGPWTWSGPRMATLAKFFSCRRARRPCSRAKSATLLKTYSLAKKGKVVVPAPPSARPSPPARPA